ncbi:MAG: hypothetical protein HC913_10700 [Microscillaceae bacterium]|nr:hypothetical protein [Microscillaceae bacterium]
MKVLILEDEAPAARRLQGLIARCDARIEVLAVVESVKKGLEWFQQQAPPDLIFSDIQFGRQP